MSKIFLYLAFIFCSLKTSYAQPPGELTDADIKRITHEVDSEAREFKRQLNSMKKDSNYIDTYIEFAVDTFRIEHYMNKLLEIDYSTMGMRSAVDEASSKYDLLLNKYYQYLIKVLLPEDKNKLREAQRAWINYKDKEMKLQGVLRNEHYSGGGTMQGMIGASNYYYFIRSRAIELYEYYSGIMELRSYDN